ncbi:hypothetical protein BC629DRAFT_763550 [Irpex lacteus]|nr:hypothetical protein BC629DRAFT_763550 [Irpex lacteus]
MNRRNPDDWFTGLTGASRNTGGPTYPSNVVLGGYPQDYGLGYAGYVEPRAPTDFNAAARPPEPHRASHVKKEASIIILDDDDDTPPSSQSAQPSSSRARPLQREPSIEFLDDPPPQRMARPLQHDPSVVILDTPPSGRIGQLRNGSSKNRPSSS